MRRIAVFGLASELPQAERVLHDWRAADFPRDHVSILALYRVAKEWGDAIIDAAETESSPSIASIELEDPAVLEVSGLGPLVAAGPVSTSGVWKNRNLDDAVVAEALRALGLGDAHVALVDRSIRRGGVFLGLAEDGRERIDRAARILLEAGIEPVAVQDELVEGRPSSQESRLSARDAYSDIASRSIREVMELEVPSIPAPTRLRVAMNRMRALDLLFIPVVSNERMVGVLTAPGIPIRRVDRGEPSEEPTAGDTMIEDFVYCFEDQTAAEAAALMERAQVTRLPVLDRDGRLRGMVRSLSALTADIEEEPLSD